MPLNAFNSSLVVAVLLVLTACSNGGGSSDDGSSGSSGSNNGASSAPQPGLQLNDGDVLGGGSSVIRIPASDSNSIVRVGSSIVRQGRIAECSGRFADESLTATSLIESCLLDQPSCAVTFQPVGDQIEVIPPPLYAPVGVEYDLTLANRDGSTTEPVRAVFCFDVGLNAPPVTASDTFQLTFPSRIQRSGVSYGDRCQKEDGSQGVLANDEDDEHITNTCLRAELVTLPEFASNDFGASFGSDGSFVYEAFGNLPAEDSEGISADSFTYRVTDGINTFSDPVRVDVVFVNSENSAPLASDDAFNITEDSAVQTFAVLNNDFDPDGLPLSVISISNGPGNGVANIRNGTLIEYRPGSGFVGQDRFTYTAEDSGGLTVTANVTINVSNVNDAPQALNDTVGTNENQPVVIQVLANDSDVENDTLAVQSVANPGNGSAIVSTNGTVIYTPDAGFFGRDSFVYTISDGSATASATVVVNVAFVNVGPAVADDQLSLDEGASEVFNLLDNDTDNDGDTLTIINVSTPANGTATLLASSNVRYTPNEGFSGTDTFTYIVSDGTVEATGQVTIVVNSVNDVPVANDDSVSTTEDTPLTIDVLSNDTDPDGDSLTVSSITNTRSGSAVINANNTVTFTPQDSFSGQAGFAYTVDDGNGGTDTAVVTVLVSDTNESPVAVDDVRTTEEDDPVGIQVLANDSDPDGDTLTLSIATQPANGVASIVSQGTVIVYSPESGFSGTDTFTYQISDGSGGTALATVTVTVSNSNVAPTAAPDAARVAQGETASIAVLANDTDPDGDSLSISIVTAPSDGSAVVQANGVIAYTANATFSGTDTLVYSIADNNGGSDTATVTITVFEVIVNGPPTAVDDVAQVAQGQTVPINVLGNDTDPDGDSLSISIVTAPSDGSVVLQANGFIAYTADATFSGTDTLVYSIADGNGGSDTASVTITVNEVIVNGPPTAADDTSQVAQGQTVPINVLGNDTDPDGDSLSVTIVAPPSDGSAVVQSNGVIAYTADDTFSGTDTLVYSIADGNGGSDTASVTITVNAVIVNGPPTAIGDVAVVNQGETVVISVLANDSDPDGDSLSVTIGTPPSNGSVVVQAGGVIAYTADATFAGTDTLVYSIADGNNGSASAVVTITVNAVIVNSPPTAVDDIAQAVSGLAVNLNILANDSDPDGDALTVSIITAPVNGVATVLPNNVISYTPAANFSGTDSIVYGVDDGNNGTDTATVSITVSSNNTAPVAVNDTAATDQGQPVSIDAIANDSDDDGDVLVITAVSPASDGDTDIVAGEASYTPAPGFTGTDSFTYVVSDGNGGEATATVTVTVSALAVTPAAIPDAEVVDQGDNGGAIDTGTVAVDDAEITNTLPIAMDDTATTEQDTAATIPVLANDSDPDGDPLTVTAVTAATNGIASINADGSVQYLPDVGYVGPDAFDYTIDDGVSGIASASVTVEVTSAAPAF